MPKLVINYELVSARPLFRLNPQPDPSTLYSYNPQQEVKDVLDHLNVTKACGPDLISPRLLKEGASVLSKPLAMVFNRSLLQGYFPSNWKDANVTAIHKKED